MHRDGFGKFFAAQVAAATAIGLVSAGIMHFRRRDAKDDGGRNHLAPLLERTESGRAGKIERFSHYLARQMGFEDESECPQLIKLAYGYLKRSKGVDEKIYEYFAKHPNAEDLYVNLVEEFERCILGYLAFHWSQAPFLITQILSVNAEQKRLKDLVIAATRYVRRERREENGRPS